MTDLLHVENMRVAQAKVHEGDARWYVTTANGALVSDGYHLRGSADQKLEDIRRRAYAEAKEEENTA